jgi:hypothetical protein
VSFDRSLINLIASDAHQQYSQYLDPAHLPQAIAGMNEAGFDSTVNTLKDLLGLTLLVVPELGAVIAAGPIVSDLNRLVTSTIPGGILRILSRNGIAKTDVEMYAEFIRRGGTLVSIRTKRINSAENVLYRYSPINIEKRHLLWIKEGWQGFNSSPVASSALVNPAALSALDQQLLSAEPPTVADDTAKSVTTSITE